MAAAQVHRMKMLSLYREMLREAQKFTGYNYRMYAVRRIQDAFRENKSETNPELIEGYIKKAQDNLPIIRRQATISQLYTEPKLVIESDTAKKS
ncbi:LYR motif-containing protein 4 [Strongylocentrotus purpuratus]|uniref:Complex 1 LYR protein domain-containing protein n=1 Tax=Strongylocentrotus purpuratus TaxID=7668 RepID=A0A7M7GGW5_STRPU|nr:LYR motif-containing protein 4 [Strongylocentrotus purpuratus]|eukprot:XP_003728295.1 PREDICTED: LYR motif-containing protein 4 isoform X1 [Strongylocentrotus purpuratus]